MPRLPSRNDLSAVPIRSNQPVISGVAPLQERAGAQLGQAIAGAGLAGMAYAREAKERQDSMAAADAQSKAAIEMIKAEQELAQDNDFATMEQRYRERLSKVNGELIGGVADPERRKILQTQLGLNLERGAARIQGLARSREIDNSRASLSSLIAQNREVALTSNDEAARAALIKSTMDAIEARRSAGHLSDSDAESVRQKFTQDYALGAADMLSPQEVISKLSGDTDGTIFGYIPADKRQNLIEQARTRIKQESAILRVGLSERVQDASAAYLQGLKYDNPPSRDEFIAAYPDDGDKRFQQFQKTSQLGEDIARIATASPEDRRAILERSNPAAAVVGAGFAADSQRFGALVKAVQGVERQLAEDPAAYAIQYSEPVKQAYERLQQDPTTVPEYARTVIAEQHRLGAQDVKLLPEAQAKAIAAQFNRSEGEDAAALVQSLSDDWGRHWPMVFKQLSKDLPPAALVIGSGVDPATAEVLARNANVKTAELKQGLDSTAVTDANRAVDEALAGFQTTLSLQGGSSTYAKINEQAKRLAYSYMAQGSNASEAAERVYRSLVDDKYSIVDTYRVPKQFDADSVADGAEAALESLDVSRLVAAAPDGLTPEFVQERIGSALRRDGRWVTNEDETGLVLTMNGSVVTDRNGNRIERSFDELVADGAAKAKSDRERMIQEVRERR